MSTINNSNLIALNGQSTPINPLDSRPAFLAKVAIPFLSKELRQALAELAASDNGQAYPLALELAIDAIELLCDVKRGAR